MLMIGYDSLDRSSLLASDNWTYAKGAHEGGGERLRRGRDEKASLISIFAISFFISEIRKTSQKS